MTVLSVLALLIFWKPMALTIILIFHRVKGDDINFGVYLGNLKSWFLSLWDLVKWSGLNV